MLKSGSYQDVGLVSVRQRCSLNLYQRDKSCVSIIWSAIYETFGKIMINYIWNYVREVMDF